jgi:hypothetical protein
LDNRQIIPQSGSFVAYKATQNNVLKVRIPEDAERVSSLTSRKCRAEFVETIEIFDEEGESCDKTKAYGRYDEDTVYREGEITEPDEFNSDRKLECTNGIHFFLTKEEATDWV